MKQIMWEKPKEHYMNDVLNMSEMIKTVLWLSKIVSSRSDLLKVLKKKLPQNDSFMFFLEAGPFLRTLLGKVKGAWN